MNGLLRPLFLLLVASASVSGQAEDEHLKEAPFDNVDLHLGRLHDSVGFFPKTDIQIGFPPRVIVGELFDRGIDEPVHKISVI